MEPLQDNTSKANPDKAYSGLPTTATQMPETNKALLEAIKSCRKSLFDDDLPPSGLDEPAATNDDGFEPCTFFFYGTLMDPEMLRFIAELDHWPELQDAWVEGLELKMWCAVYPALTHPPHVRPVRVDGKAWCATTMDQCLRLQQYETSAYEGYKCAIHLSTGDVVKGLTFVWAGDPGSSQLSEGTFDLTLWQQNHKQPMF